MRCFIMDLPYAGTTKILETFGISNNEELTNIILNPHLYDSYWTRARQQVGHDYHDLSLLHDTLCYIHRNKGKIKQEQITTLRDCFQDGSDYVSQCIIPTLEELGLIEHIADDNVIALTDKGYELHLHPTFLEIAVE